MGTPAFPDLGKHCSVTSCQQIDFLPFTCDKCRMVFCLSHRMPASHECPRATVGDAVVLLCPLCAKAVRLVGDEDPNVTWARHERSGCDPSNLQRVPTDIVGFLSAGCKQALFPPNSVVEYPSSSLTSSHHLPFCPATEWQTSAGVLHRAARRCSHQPTPSHLTLSILSPHLLTSPFLPTRRVANKRRCAAQGCKEVLSPANTITCRDCTRQTCLRHRFGADHACSGSQKNSQPVSFWTAGGAYSEKLMAGVQGASW
ncbi:unnamed protein product [Closterium sp. Naga37s-1]|nr:unnamed protein product [Closterium sp. Naga37s-1]